ncbi:MAG: serine/threonine-protein kinase [Polyangiaceae bacterium]
MSAESGDLIGGKYRLEKPLAKGGMGSVWLARHTELDAPVAVKFMAIELAGTAAAVARFKREAKAAAQLRSPHVVHIHDYGVEEGTPFMVMELLDGEDLAGELARVRRLSVERIAGIVTQVAKALSLAHAAGIVHRDLKPSNLFLARSGEDEIVKVLDFGVAKETMPTLVVDRTTSGVLIGSPQYMSPEQARGEPVDLRSDLWSLGVVVYEALTGSPPFESQHLGALLAKIHEASPLPPRALVASLPAGVDDFMRRALARQPEDRFASAKAMADALSALASAGEVRREPAPGPGVGARSVVVVDPRAPVGRNADTLPAEGPNPVSTTMHGDARAKAPAPGKKRAIVSAGIAVAAAVIALAVWLGVQPGSGDITAASDETGANAAGATLPHDGAPSVEPAGPVTTSAAASTTASAGTGEPGTTASGSAATTSATASAAGATTNAAGATGTTASAAGATTSTRTTTATAPATTSTARTTASAAGTGTATRTAPAASATASTTSAPATKSTAYDPIFGLPAKSP